MSSNRQRDELVAALVDDLQPVRWPGRAWPFAFGWLLLAGLATALAMLIDGPLRQGALQQLASSPRLLLEIALGSAASAALGLAAFRSAIPGPRPLASRAWPALLLLTGWVLLALAALFDPALSPSMDGKRDYCWIQVPLFALPGLLPGLYWLRRLYPVDGAWSGALLGLAAGVIPAVMMQLACMYEPTHNLVRHLLPGLALGLAGALAGYLALRRRGLQRTA